MTAESGATALRDAESIDTLEALLFAEVQELRSAELQLAAELASLPQLQWSTPLLNLLRGYPIELNSRREDLERMLGEAGMDPRQHTDQAMRSLIAELLKMSQLREPRIRDAAFIDSLQRIVHVKIAAYGSVATFAKRLNRTDDAARLAEYGEREKAFDAELTAVVVTVLNSQPPPGRPAH
jgi:ferritin-like metal-binding protein YciE